LFLPQRPYLPLGTLRQAITYPDGVTAHGDAEVHAVLRDVGLGHLDDRLDEEDAWGLRLSGGEQQRLAIGRAVLARPDWLFLDEATSSLDAVAEAELYALLRARLPQATLVSVAHRQAVSDLHARRVRLDGGRLVPA
jgi:putative ATP-binding cassette transporter